MPVLSIVEDLDRHLPPQFRSIVSSHALKRNIYANKGHQETVGYRRQESSENAILAPSSGSALVNMAHIV